MIDFTTEHPPGSDFFTERHEPEWYRRRQLALHEQQRRCWSFHPPETKKHPLCDKCFVTILQQAAATERDRAASFVESLGHPELAEKIRRLR